jgi:D-alanyl-D-alanine carboxypeptidase/D-alanyl-D-alanine-endopeptidase (penicillin-binding protein 4)
MMHPIIHLVAILCLCLPFAASAQLPAPVAGALKAAGIPASAVSLHVQEVGGGAVRASHNAGAAMNPASVMKLLTTYAALELLGPAHVWKTEAWVLVPPDENGIVAGDLYLRGSGDPKLNFEQFWLLLRQLRARGVRDVRGDLVLDRTLFDLPEHDPSARMLCSSVSRRFASRCCRMHRRRSSRSAPNRTRLISISSI